jgi:hypothetical protein
MAAAGLAAIPAAAATQLPGQSHQNLLKTPLAASGPFTVSGTVTDQAGTPVYTVEVFAFRGATQVRTYTDLSGHYTLSLPEGTYEIVFHPPVTSSLASQARRWIRESQVLDIILPPGHVVSGTVYSDTAKLQPVGNVSIFAFNLDTYSGFGVKPTLIDGTYILLLETANWELTFSPPHFLGLGPTRTNTISLTGDLNLDIVLPPGFTVYDEVQDPNGDPVPNVEIFAQDHPEPGFGFTPTDSDGIFTGTLPTGTFDILFFAPPFQELGSTVVTGVSGPPDIQLDVTLPSGHTVSGMIRCADKELANSYIEAQPHPPISIGDGFFGWGRFAGADGFYALALQPGIYDFYIDPPGDDLPTYTRPIVTVNQDLILTFDYCTIFLPVILK